MQRGGGKSAAGLLPLDPLDRPTLGLRRQRGNLACPLLIDYHINPGQTDDNGGLSAVELREEAQIHVPWGAFSAIAQFGHKGSLKSRQRTLGESV